MHTNVVYTSKTLHALLYAKFNFVQVLLQQLLCISMNQIHTAPRIRGTLFSLALAMLMGSSRTSSTMRGLRKAGEWPLVVS